ncbi:NADH:ubiquinone reductase (Na(+)-transporting) subunit C [Sunxiuqinia elliptica]|uniref:Na(+)-translocating NADH-quinone reductase subunit C n=1 Tax=Sunxiuqinia elliptica TaxID=655355 RepID=A0A4R6H4Y4_9BACT|nr:NADH:ubiquinone reductase (Na(+)-transporting) subunit C [Sunxiuqinia elliptica]TDO03303.1 Na+-transporting NADH:ubiquinone oxidoreductase subunit C [Sunxiuqinia elliptica]TDO59500.1 Na+-transporting NADH:ubiquinone oxidoreductase subunit C [Sunxiuqinia elliptica]
MDRNSNVYTFIYASGMVIVVAAILSIAAINLKPFQDRNIEVEKKQNILASVNIQADATNAEEIYAEKIVNSYVVNSKGEKVEGDAFTVDLKKERAKPTADQKLPVFECQIDGGVKYIVPLRGAGLWGPIWGYLSLEDDMSTIYGASFDHQGETPGLGAEISTDAFEIQFKHKEIYESGNLVSITVAKANETAPEQHKVDAISGGTITSKGLEKMLLDDLSSYNAFFNQKK